jgi:hypothetical protein
LQALKTSAVYSWLGVRRAVPLRAPPGRSRYVVPPLLAASRASCTWSP